MDNKADLRNLLFVSRDFFAETEHVLYESVTFQQQPGQTVPESCQVLMRLMQNQRLAVHIRALDLKSLLRPDGMSDADWREFFEVGVWGLSNFHAKAGPLAPISIYDRRLPSSWPHFGLFPSFFRPSYILELHARRPYYFQGLSFDVLPNLKTISATEPTCRALFPGRSIQCLELVPSLPRSLEPVPGISSLRQLSITYSDSLLPFQGCFEFLEGLVIETVRL